MLQGKKKLSLKETEQFFFLSVRVAILQDTGPQFCYAIIRPANLSARCDSSPLGSAKVSLIS
jgi:hypothetical protein